MPDDRMYRLKASKLCGFDEEANSRPCVLGDKLWFAHKKKDTPYIISCYDMEKRTYEKDVLPRGDGWDNEMVCYPYVFEHDGQIYMMYNGNGYGGTGVGLAILE